MKEHFDLIVASPWPSSPSFSPFLVLAGCISLIYFTWGFYTMAATQLGGKIKALVNWGETKGRKIMYAYAFLVFAVIILSILEVYARSQAIPFSIGVFFFIPPTWPMPSAMLTFSIAVTMSFFSSFWGLITIATLKLVERNSKSKEKWVGRWNLYKEGYNQNQIISMSFMALTFIVQLLFIYVPAEPVYDLMTNHTFWIPSVVESGDLWYFISSAQESAKQGFDRVLAHDEGKVDVLRYFQVLRRDPITVGMWGGTSATSLLHIMTPKMPLPAKVFTGAMAAAAGAVGAVYVTGVTGSLVDQTIGTSTSPRD